MGGVRTSSSSPVPLVSHSLLFAGSTSRSSITHPSSRLRSLCGLNFVVHWKAQLSDADLARRRQHHWVGRHTVATRDEGRAANQHVDDQRKEERFCERARLGSG